MAPDLLIIGERDEREDLSKRVAGFGYRCEGAGARSLADHLEPPVPAAILLCAQGCDVRAVLRELRRDPQGLGIPVILYSELGGEIRDLADVLELGADRFLVAPVDDEELREALLELLGPSEPTPLAPVTGAADLSLRQRDPLLAQLKRTLAALDERSDAGAPGSAEGEGDDVDLDGIGLGGGPGLEGASAGAEISPDLSLIDVEPATRRIARPRRPSATVRLEDDDDGAARARVTLRKAAAASASGELTLEPLPELLARLESERFSGLLRVRGPGTVDVEWLGGAPVDARSDRPELRLSVGLRRRGLIDAEAARGLRERLPTDTLADLDAAVEAGAVKPRERAALRDEIVAEHLTAGFAWEGRWSLHPAGVGAGSGSEQGPALRRTLAAVIVEGALLGLEEPLLRARLGPGELRPRQRGPLPSDLEAPAEAVALGPLTGALSLDELAALGGRPLLAWVYGLWVIGGVELAEGDAGAGDEAAAAVDRRRIFARLALARDGDYFALLERPADASRGELRRAHSDLTRAFADDRLEPQTRATMAEELAELRAALDEARDVLLDEALRAAYLALRAG